MFPSLVAEETKAAVSEYLSTTFALADAQVRAALRDFLHDPVGGIFKGPYLRVRTPFLTVDEGWRSPLSWLPAGFTPYRHQARAFQRLSTRGRVAEPTIVTTGTGSGKTESFLVPLLDHARRTRERGEPGVKALVLYPMNALVTDQASRLARLLHDDQALAGVSAGVYIGGPGTRQHSSRDGLVDDREVLRRSPPDILLTNYKMLDLLLLRPADAGIWAQARSSLQFVVLDEFHTYDGAQGTDVAMLLRRLGAAVGVAEAGRPLGRVTPVATSATLGGGSRSDDLRAFAETVFGTPFGPDSVVTEERLAAEDVIADVDFEMQLPDVEALAGGLRHRTFDADDDDSWRPLAELVLRRDEKPVEVRDRVHLADLLSRHFLTRVVVQALSGAPLSVGDAIEQVARNGALQWGMRHRSDPRVAEQALLGFLALLSAAKVGGSADGRRPFLQVEVQLWLRELSRILRPVSPTPEFAWWHDGTPDGERQWLPAVFCRSCGRSGWQAIQPELGTALVGTPTKVWQQSVGGQAARAKTRAVLLADAGDPQARWLRTSTLELLPAPEDDTVPVLVTPTEEAAKEQQCPSCGSNDAIRFLGAAVATLASVALTQAFGSTLIPEREKKTLVFTDSVQDAAHRAAFIEGRAFAFNFRSALIGALAGEPTALDVLSDRLAVLDASDLYAVTPPDFTRRLGLEGEWLKGRQARRTRALLATRLAFQAQIEVGLRSRLGRTLELTGTVAVDIDTDLDSAAGLARETHANLPQLALVDLPDQRAYQAWLLGLLERLRTRGGIVHPWLRAYMNDDGRRWSIWGRSPAGMPKFPKGRPAPTFFTTIRGTDFDSLAPQGDSWLTDWTSRCLGVSATEARALLGPVVRQLATGDGPLDQVASKKGGQVLGLKPGCVLLEPISEERLSAGQAVLGCPHCDHLQPVSERRAQLWADAACPRMRCPGRLQPLRVEQTNFYRDLYRSARVRRIVTHEHTGLLDRVQREQVESRFKAGSRPVDPNILTCTPTLELGIDIGDLSTVTLSSLPRATANYLQRVGRAGRSTGNAFVLATAPSRPRDLYYFADPTTLIDGEVTPPGAYLNATELLQRQFLAYCLDRVADGNLDLPRAMPNLLGQVLTDGLAEGEWLRSLLDTVVENHAELATGFLDLYGAHLDPPARDAVLGFASGGLGGTVARAVADWLRHRRNLDERIAGLAQSIHELDRMGHLDDSQQEERRRWAGELKGLRGARKAMGERDTLTGLVELGLLPNYNLMDDATTLDVQLWWTNDDAGSEESRFQTVEHSIARGSRSALTELAPGSTFYVYGRKIEIDGVDLGPAGQPEWRIMRLCPECGWGADDAGQPIQACPRCHSSKAADAGARHTVLPLRRVSAVQHRDESVVDEESESRVRTSFHTVTGVSVRRDDVTRAWRLKDVAFGAEYVRAATIRTLNLGLRDQLGAGQVTIAGQMLPAAGFLTCEQCGVVAHGHDLDRIRHRGWCRSRRGSHPPDWQRLFLSHELTTQAVRLLLPLSTLQVEQRLASFAAALLLGLRSDFGGDPQHLSIVTATLPDAERRPRQFVVLHDLVPGGTGYLDRFGEPDRLHRILTLARTILAECPCRHSGHRACHRCLLGVAPPHQVELVDRELALALLDETLQAWEPEPVQTVTDIEIRDVVLSELEVRFRELVKNWVAAHEEDGHACDVGVGAGGEELDLRLACGERVRRWRVRQQVDVPGDHATRPDLVITRQDAQDAPIAVYLDGRQYHASVEHNRTEDDARKRDWLRSEGHRVWSISWEDVDDFDTTLAGRPRDTEPVVSRRVSGTVGSKIHDPRVQKLWGNPIELLLAYLVDPQAEVWGAAVEQTLFSVLATSDHGSAAPVTVSPAEAAGALLRLAQGGSVESDGDGRVALAARHGRSGLPLILVGDIQGDSASALGALAVLEDRPHVVGGPGHEAQWRDWLRWGNLLQFLTRPRHRHEWPLRMAAVWTTQSLHAFAQAALPIAALDAPARADVEYSTDWQVVVEYTDESLHGLAERLDRAGLPAPIPGDEVGEDAWQVEYSWPNAKVAVVLDEQPHRETWLAARDWQVVQWSADLTEDQLADIIVRAVKGAGT